MMMPRNKKGKTNNVVKRASPKKSDAPRKKTPSPASSKKKDELAGKQSEISSQKGKKFSSGTKKGTRKPLKAGKKLPASPAPKRKTSEGKPSGKSTALKAKTVKKKVAAPKTAKKTVAKKTLRESLPKASATSAKSLSKTKKEIPEKAKVRTETATKKSAGRVLNPLSLKKKGEVLKRAKRPEKKNASGEISGKASEDVSRTVLPSEYGENELIVMVVDPNIVFVDWEIKKDEVPGTPERLTMRVFDMTGGPSMRPGRDAFFDIKIDGRVGCGFFELKMPGRDVAMEIGLRENGKFRPILHSAIVSIPRSLESDELGIARKMFGSAPPVGY